MDLIRELNSYMILILMHTKFVLTIELRTLFTTDGIEQETRTFDKIPFVVLYILLVVFLP